MRKRVNLSLDDLLTQATCSVIDKKKVIGTAWLVSENGHLLTAGHIIGERNPLKSVYIQFPEDHPREAYKIQWSYQPESGDDFAILKLTDLSANRQPLPISLTEKISGSFRLRGYGISLREQSVGTGELVGHFDPQNAPENRLFQLRSQELGEQGYSGAAVFSDIKDAIVAIQIESTTTNVGPGRDTILAMPLYRIAQKWELLAEIHNKQIQKTLQYAGANKEIFYLGEFVARDQEIHTFEKLVSKKQRAFDLVRVLFIKGMAGIGKSMLLKRLSSICIDRRISHCFLDLEGEKDPALLMTKIANQLSTNYAIKFGSFIESVGNYERLRKTRSTEDEKTHHKKEVRRVTEEFISCILDNIAKNTPIIFFVDTYEEFKFENEWFRYFVHRLIEDPSKPIYFVIGSRIDAKWDWIDREFWRKRIMTIKISPFTFKDISFYIKKRLKSKFGSIEEKIKYRIHELTEGHPLSVSIAVDDLESALENGELLDADYLNQQAIRLDQKIVAQFFYNRIVNRISDNNLRLALLYGIIMRRLNAEVLVSVLDGHLTYKEADEVVQKLKGYSFVERYKNGKDQYFKIHNLLRRARLYELREDILKFRDYHYRAFSYYQKAEKTISENKTEIKQQFLAQKMYHQLVIDEESGFKLFRELFDQAITHLRFAYCSHLVELAEEQELSLPNKRWIEYFKGTVANSYNKWSVSIEIFSSLSTKKLPIELRAKALNEKANALHRLGKWSEAAELYSQSIEILKDSESAYVWNKLGSLYRQQSEWVKALKCYEHNLVISQTIGDTQGQANAQNYMGILLKNIGDFQKASKNYNDALSIYQRLKNRAEELKVLNNLGILYWYQGKWQESIKLLEQSLVINRQICDRYGEGHALNGLGRVKLAIGESNEARNLFFKCFDAFESVGNQYGCGIAQQGIGEAYARLKEYPEAKKHLEKALEITSEQKNKYGQGFVYDTLGEIARQEQDWECAIKYYETSLELKQKLGSLYDITVTRVHLCMCYQQCNKFRELTRLWKKAWATASEATFFDQMAQLNFIYGEYLFTKGKTHKALTYYVSALVDAMNYNPITLQKTWQKLKNKIFKLSASKKKRTAKIYINKIININAELSLTKEIPDFNYEVASIKKSLFNNKPDPLINNG
jgi:tetratricopeptide (TPR) repeat protein